MSTIEDARRLEADAAEARRLGIPEWQLEMARAVPADVIADIVADSRRGSIHEPSSPFRPPPERQGPPSSGSGWEEAKPLRPQTDIHLIDRLVDVQDGIDRAERVRTLAGAKAKP